MQFIPMVTGTAGGIGLLVLVAPSLLSLLAVPVGLYHTLSSRRDRVLLVLAVATVLMLVQLFVAFGPVRLRNILSLLYGLVVVAGAGSWFLYRRSKLTIC